MTPSRQLIWLKRDLRLTDHAPLVEAAQRGEVAWLYIVEPELYQQPDGSNRHWQVVRDALLTLQEDIQRLGGELCIKVGEAVGVLEWVYHTWGEFELWSHEETGNAWTYRRDQAVLAWCKSHRVGWHECPANGVVRRLQSRDEWAQIRQHRMVMFPLAIPSSMRLASPIPSDPIPNRDDPRLGKVWPRTIQPGGTRRARQLLDTFLSTRSQQYLFHISKPGMLSATHCSRLSPHIALGTISIREAVHATANTMATLYQANTPSDHAHIRHLDAFLSRLAWRCHFVQKLEQQPSIETQCIHPAFEGMRPIQGPTEWLQAWQTGHTGYPIVDACMRSLIETGWLTFRMRALLVSFASYHLWLDWRETAPYLAQLFTDYEPGIHYPQFQMQSGVTGMNAIRMYHPTKQSIEHDPKGQFIRRFVPELASVPDVYLHEPSRWSGQTQYPPPIVDHATAMRIARDHIAQRRQLDGFKQDAKATFQRLGSRKRSSTSRPTRRVLAEGQQLSLFGND